MKLLASSREEQTYAQIVKRPERKRNLSRNREESHVAIIYPKDEKDVDEERDSMKKLIDPTKIRVGIKRVKKGE